MLGSQPPAVGHGLPVDLAVWGDFPLPVARCQRTIGRAAAACGLRVWRARRDCALSRLAAKGCDQGATDAAVEAARIAAIDDVSANCAPQQLTALQFLDVRDAQADVVRFCREVEAVTSSLVLEPLAAARGTPGPCAERTAHATTSVLAAAFRARQHLLNRIAINAVPVPAKPALVQASTAAIARLVRAAAADLAAQCPPGPFVALFGRDPHAVLVAAATRADCLAGDAYAQGGLVCPAPVCGNRIREGTEECDDGNAASGGDCSSDCRRQGPQVR